MPASDAPAAATISTKKKSEEFDGSDQNQIGSQFFMRKITEWHWASCRHVRSWVPFGVKANCRQDAGAPRSYTRPARCRRSQGYLAASGWPNRLMFVTLNGM